MHVIRKTHATVISLVRQSCAAACILVGTSAVTLPAADTYNLHETYRDYVAWTFYEGEMYLELASVSRVRISGFIEWGQTIDLSAFDNAPAVHLGWCSGTVDEDPKYYPGRRSACLPIDYVDPWNDDRTRIGSLKLRWNARGLWFLLRFRPSPHSNLLAYDFIDSEPGPLFSDEWFDYVSFGNWEKEILLTLTGTLSRTFIPSLEYEDEVDTLNSIVLKGAATNPMPSEGLSK